MAFELPFSEAANEKAMKENKNINVQELEKLKKKTTEPLTMDHIFFPLGLWLAGLLLSALFLLAEMIGHRIGKSKTDVSTVSEVKDRARIEFQEDFKELEVSSMPGHE